MQDDLPLTKLLNRYFQGFFSRKELEGRIFQFILDNYQQFHPYKWDKDDYMDYLCWLYPRISRAIDRYQDTGASFDAYMNSLLYWSAREYRCREADHHLVEYTCWKAKALDEAACKEEESVYIEPEPVFGPVSNPRQVLILLLKSYHYLSEDFLERIAPALKIDKKKLGELVEELRKLRLGREEEIRSLQERIHCQYYRCVTFEKKMMTAPPNSACYEKLNLRLIRGRKRLESMRKQLAGLKTEASNQQVAKILAVPKGTIDANLYILKTKWKTQKHPGEDQPEE